MGDYFIALFFWAIYEVFSWPMRLALQPVPMAPDVRRMISRVAGPLVICFVSWFFARLFVPLHFTTIWFWWLVAFWVALWSCRRMGHTPDWRAVFSIISDAKNRRRELFVEGLGFFIFFAFLYFRRLAPEMTTAQINSGLAAEKFDNAMIFWSSFFATWSPPEDYWLAGHAQAYYYFGHFFWAWIGRAALLPGEWIITLAMSRLVLSVWEGCYLLVRSFGARSLSAAIGAFLIAWGGNPRAVERLHLQYNDFTGRAAQPAEERKFILDAEYREKVTADTRRFLRGYDWWGPSRALRGEDITEFLSWTAILGDFHAHHLSIPWMLAWFAIIIAGDRWFKLRKNHILPPKRKKRKKDNAEEADSTDVHQPSMMNAVFMNRGALWLLSFLSLGVAATISNLWVAPMVGLASLAIFFWRDGRGWKGKLLRLALIPLLAVSMVTGILLSKGSLETPIESLNKEADPNKGFFAKILEKSPIKPLPKEIRSTVPMLARHWGFHVGILVVAFVCLIAGRMGRLARQRPILFGSAVGVFLVCLLVKWKILPNEPSVLWAGFAALMLCFAWGKRPGFRPIVTAFLCIGCLLLGSFEIFFFNDAYDGLMERYNTYFKFSYPIWPVMGAAAWMCAQRLWYWTGLQPVKWAFRVCGLILVPFVMVMTLVGLPARTVMARWDDVTPREPTLNAVDWLEVTPPWQHEGRMLRWIRENIEPGTRIAESNDPKHGAYGYQGRVASLAGRPIPVGWTHHEHQWRGFATTVVNEQYSKVDALYNSTTKEQVLAAAKVLEVEWVVLGKMEREALGAARFARFYTAISQAQVEWQGFPENKPEVFIFRLPKP